MTNITSVSEVTLNKQKNYDFKIHIFNNIDDPHLASAWRKIQKENNYFPQSYYEWCSPWWRYYRSSRELYVIAVCDKDNNIVGIAPLCIEKHFVFRILRSFPIHFGDFYTFLIEKGDNYSEILNMIINHILSFAQWDLVYLQQINSEDPIYKFLLDKKFISKKITDIIIANLEGKTFEQYMQGLSQNRKDIIKKKRRRLERDFKVDLIAINNAKDYYAYFDIMKRIYEKRWSDYDAKLLSDDYYKMRNTVMNALFEAKCMAFYLLKANTDVIAYQLGFIFENTFYTWKEAFNPSYAYYSPGQLIKVYMIEDLIERGFKRINFMAGAYDWKATLAADKKITTNYALFFGKHSLKGWLLLRYYTKWRDIGKKIYNSVVKPVLRRILIVARRIKQK